MGLYLRGLIFECFFVSKSLGLYSRGLIIEGAYARDFMVLQKESHMPHIFCIHVYYHTTLRTLSTQNKREDGGP